MRKRGLLVVILFTVSDIGQEYGWVFAANLAFMMNIALYANFIVLFNARQRQLAIVLYGFELIMFDEPAHLFDLELADPVLLLLFLQLLVEGIQPRLALLDLALPLTHLEPILLVFFGYLLLKGKLFTLQLVQVLLLSPL